MRLPCCLLVFLGKTASSSPHQKSLFFLERKSSMASGWNVASVGWAMIVLGWLVSPVIAFLLPKIFSYLEFDLSEKVRELKIHIIPGLQQTLNQVDQARMLQRGLVSGVAVLDEMAAILRHAREDAQDIFDDAQHKVVVGDGAVEACVARGLGIAGLVRSGSARLLQWAQRTCCWSRFLPRASVEAVTAGAAASDEQNPATIVTIVSAAASDEPNPAIIAGAAASDEPNPGAAPSHSSRRWLSYLCSSFHFLSSCCGSIFYWLLHAINVACFYRNWSYSVVGITTHKEDATALDIVLTAISRWGLKKKIEKIESIVTEVKKSPLMGVESKSSPSDIANKNRSKIRTGSKRKVFGREVLRDYIMAILREIPDGDSQSSSSSPCFSVIGIYGVAGSGKTTFARYIRDYIKLECNEKLFDTIMCIHVSETFNVDDIFHDMLKDITKDRHSNITDREELEEKLKESLRSKRFLLILDDIWVKNKNDLQLEELISPLNVGMKGSKILVTARTKYAAGALCAAELIKIPDLDEDQYLSMFMHYALGGTSSDHGEFISVGRMIAKKLHRSPIAAVTVAGQLGTNPNISFWKNTAMLEMLNDTMDALWWSCQQLNPDMRQCLEYCNIFPRRFKMIKDELVHLWIAQGFVKTSCASEDMEDVAEGYIQELVSCSFLQPEGTKSDTDCFTIHDLVHDLLDKVAGSDYYRIDNPRSKRGKGWKGDVPRDVRHLFVRNYDGELITQKILGLENLRTLIVYDVGTDTPMDSPVDEKVIESICERLLKLRVLAVKSQELFEIEEAKNFSVPESISRLKYLRYLALRIGYTCMLILPSTLTKLHHIQLLDFGFSEIPEFPFADLINLRRIFIWPHVECANIGSLVSLQSLIGFTVSKEQGYEVKQLRDLNKLRGSLQISGLENVNNKEEALEANLAAKERLRKLALEWGDAGDTRCSPEIEAEVLEGLCPHVGLESLTIVQYKGSRYPDWMVGKKIGLDLQELSFLGCSQLGPAPALEGLPHLRLLLLVNCSWDALPGNMEHLTSLKILDIVQCMNIFSLPTLPQSLEEFYLDCCDGEFMKSCRTAGHPNWKKIRHIPKKTIKDPAPFSMGKPRR